MAKTSLLGHRHSHIIIILLSMLIGFAVAAVVIYSPPAQQQVTPPAAAQGLADLEEGFIGVADRVRPAVVNISAERAVPSRELDLKDFFDKFPWPFGQGPDDEFRFPFRQDQDKDKQDEEPPPMAHSLGSGWIYSEDGYIVTNNHVIKDASDIKVRLFDKKSDEQDYEAEVVGVDPKTDLAVLKIDAPRKLPTLQLGSSADARVGQWVVAVGSPLGWDQTVTVGVISAKGRILNDPHSPYIRLGDLIQTDAAINRGNSGGPLVNLRGEVVGINVAIAASGMMGGNIGIGFAIPADTAKNIVPQLISEGVVKRGWLGIGIEDLTPNTKDFYGVDHGALVTAIHEDAPAADSDLRVEDVIVAVNGKPVNKTWDLQQAIGNAPPGATVTLQVIRDKKEATVEVKLGEMPGKYAGRPEPEEPEEIKPEKPSGALGVTVRSITAQDKRKFDDKNLAGVVVAKVNRGGPAAGSLMVGDVVSKVDRTPVASLDDWEKALEEAKEDGESYIVLRVSRILGDEVAHLIVDIDVDW